MIDQFCMAYQPSSGYLKPEHCERCLQIIDCKKVLKLIIKHFPKQVQLIRSYLWVEEEDIFHSQEYFCENKYIEPD